MVKKNGFISNSFVRRFLTLTVKTFLAFILSTGLLLATMDLIYFGKIYPGVFMLNSNLSGKTQSEVENLLNEVLKPPTTIRLVSDKNIIDMDLMGIEFSYNVDKTANKAYRVHRSGNYYYETVGKVDGFFHKTLIKPEINIDEAKLEEFINIVSDQIDIPATDPTIKKSGSSEISIDQGLMGKRVIKSDLYRKIVTNLENLNYSQIEIPTENYGDVISDFDLPQLQKRAEMFINSEIVIIHDTIEVKVDDSSIFTFINLDNDYDINKIESYIKNHIAQAINRDPQNAVFKSEEGRVVDFTPSKPGYELKNDLLLNEILESLAQIEKGGTKTAKIEASVDKKEPTIQNSEVNDLGIKDLLGTGTSYFKGSIPGRIHNVVHATTKLDGILIEPGETVSFNAILGDVSALTGYKQAYIIKDGRTILGDGGGVCQTSTTLFRALLSAGLPVIERRAHAYRVGYYEQGSPPGIDATVYYPTTDLKFKNDTPGYILIQAKSDAKEFKLTYEIYGTSDGRVSEVEKPVISSVTAPSEDIYQDDPSLALGKIVQVEHRANGAKVTFNYTVKRGEEIIFQKDFVSNYRPWQAVYLRGTKEN